MMQQDTDSASKQPRLQYCCCWCCWLWRRCLLRISDSASSV